MLAKYLAFSVQKNGLGVNIKSSETKTLAASKASATRKTAKMKRRRGTGDTDGLYPLTQQQGIPLELLQTSLCWCITLKPLQGRNAGSLIRKNGGACWLLASNQKKKKTEKNLPAQSEALTDNTVEDISRKPKSCRRPWRTLTESYQLRIRFSGRE